MTTHLSDDMTGLHIAKSLDVLCHGTIEVTLAIEVVAIQPMNGCDARLRDALGFGQVERKCVKIPLIENVKFRRRRVLLKARQLDRSTHASVAPHLSIALVHVNASPLVE